MKRLVLAVVMLVASVLAASVRGGEFPVPTGPVVLTITGNITNTNRAPFNEFEDVFLHYHEKVFERAAEFDRGMLERFGMHEITVSYKKWPKSYRLEGPWLKDVLAAVGGSGKPITLLALDGYAAEIPIQDLDALPWILAVKLDGQYLKLGQRGPLWVAYSNDHDKEITEEEESKWVWGTFYIEVQ